MKKEEALIERDVYRPKLIGKLFNQRQGWDIKDLIISVKPQVGNIYSKMYDNNITNEAALLFFPTKEEDYTVFVIAHQWPWGSGDLLFERLESYLKANPF